MVDERNIMLSVEKLNVILKICKGEKNVSTPRKITKRVIFYRKKFGSLKTETIEWRRQKFPPV